MNQEEVVEHIPEGNPVGVEDDLDRLGVAARILLGRVVALAAGPSHSRGDDSVTPDLGFGDPLMVRL